MKHKYLTPKQRRARILTRGMLTHSTKSDLARAIGTTQRNLGNLLSAENPKINTLIRIADALGVPVAHLIEK